MIENVGISVELAAAPGCLRTTLAQISAGTTCQPLHRWQVVIQLVKAKIIQPAEYHVYTGTLVACPEEPSIGRGLGDAVLHSVQRYAQHKWSSRVPPLAAALPPQL